MDGEWQNIRPYESYPGETYRDEPYSEKLAAINDGKRARTRRTLRIATIKRASEEAIVNEFALVMSRGYRGDIDGGDRLKAIGELFAD